MKRLKSHYNNTGSAIIVVHQTIKGDFFERNKLDPSIFHVSPNTWRKLSMRWEELEKVEDMDAPIS